MNTKVVLFDLDGTLLPMDQSLFIKTYFGTLTEYMATKGYDRKLFSKALLAGIDGMMNNNGTLFNEELFWKIFLEVLGCKREEAEIYLDEFYDKFFDDVKRSCGFDPKAADVIKAVKEKGYRVALATNPVFPAIATRKRIAWAGLSPEDFEIITSYENSTYSKPSLEYYREVAKRLNVSPEECLMVGNDTRDDMVVCAIGMKTFLVTPCLINDKGVDISAYNNGSLVDLIKFV